MPYDRFLDAPARRRRARSPAIATRLIATGFCRCGPREVVGGNVDPRGQAAVGAHRDHRHGRLGLPRPDDRLRPLPRPQVRRHPDDRLLPAPVLLRRVASSIDLPIASKAERDAFAAAEKAIEAKIAPSRKQLAELEAPYRKAPQGREAGHAQRRRAGRDGDPREGPDAGAEAAGARACRRRCGSPGRRSPRPSRPIPPTTPGARRSSERSTRSNETLPRPPAHAMALVDQKSKATDTFVLRRGDYKNTGPKVAPRPPGVILASQRRRRVHARSIVPTGRQDGPPGGAGAVAGRRRQSADGARHRQPALAVPFRPGDRGHLERLRRAGRAARRIPSCSTGSRPS